MNKSRVLLGLILVCCYASAQAVYLNPRGLGQVLLFAYYTARSTTANDAYNTLVVVTNTTNDVQIVRVRLREARNGRQVANVNVYLTPHDSWTMAITPGSNGPLLTTRDQSCLTSRPAASAGVIPLTNFFYSGLNGDGEDSSIDRASEGFIEVIAMGVVTDPRILAALMINRDADRVALPVIPNCAAAQAINLSTDATVFPPTGGLMGTAFIVNVPLGTLYSYDALALDEFTQLPIYVQTDQPAPSLQDVNPKVATIIDKAGAHVTHWDVSRGAHPSDPVSAVLMQNQIVNQYILDRATNSGTSWVVTMPTKQFYVQLAPLGSGLPPFQSPFSVGGSPDYFGIEPSGLFYADRGNTQLYDREGGFIEGRLSFGPNPPAPVINLPWSANVINFVDPRRATPPGVFGSRQPIALHPPIGENGWARLEPFQPTRVSGVHKLVSTDTPPVTLYGLPMIGFMANSYFNGELRDSAGTVVSNYGGTAMHKGSVRIE